MGAHHGPLVGDTEAGGLGWMQAWGCFCFCGLSCEEHCTIVQGELIIALDGRGRHSKSRQHRSPYAYQPQHNSQSTGGTIPAGGHSTMPLGGQSTASYCRGHYIQHIHHCMHIQTPPPTHTRCIDIRPPQTSF